MAFKCAGSNKNAETEELNDSETFSDDSSMELYNTSQSKRENKDLIGSNDKVETTDVQVDDVGMQVGETGVKDKSTIERFMQEM